MDLYNGLIPMVIETSGRGERAYDIYSLLLKERIVFLGTGISDQIANLIVAQLLYLNREDPEREIQMYINSPGGMIYAGLAVYATMRQISAPVMSARWLTASFGTLLLSAPGPSLRSAQRDHSHAPALTSDGGGGDRHRNPGPRICASDLLAAFCRNAPASRWLASEDTDRLLHDGSRPKSTTSMTTSSSPGKKTRARKTEVGVDIDYLIGPQRCSFCRRSIEAPLIWPDGVFICDECVHLCHDILHEQSAGESDFRVENVPSPRILAELDKYVIGQDTSAARWPSTTTTSALTRAGPSPMSS